MSNDLSFFLVCGLHCICDTIHMARPVFFMAVCRYVFLFFSDAGPVNETGLQH